MPPRWTPAAPLTNATLYTVTLPATDGVTDTSNNGLVADVSWSFTTAVPPDVTPPAVTATTPSPFDYHKQTLLLAPSHFPDPGAAHFGRAVGEVLRELALGVPRKTMGLFTSYRMIREAEDILRQAGLTEDTVVIHISDNGHFLGEHQQCTRPVHSAADQRVAFRLADR